MANTGASTGFGLLALAAVGAVVVLGSARAPAFEPPLAFAARDRRQRGNRRRSSSIALQHYSLARPWRIARSSTTAARFTTRPCTLPLGIACAGSSLRACTGQLIERRSRFHAAEAAINGWQWLTGMAGTRLSFLQHRKAPGRRHLAQSVLRCSVWCAGGPIAGGIARPIGGTIAAPVARQLAVSRRAALPGLVYRRGFLAPPARPACCISAALITTPRW